MTVQDFARDARSRRDLFRMAGLAAGGGSVALLAACGDAGGGGGGEADVSTLNGALAIEHTLVAAYTAGAELLTGETLALVRRFREQEREHARRLAREVRELGGVPREARSREEYARSFPRLRGRQDVLRFAVDLEQVAVSAYLDAIPKLSDPQLRQAAGAINTVEAGHVSVLAGALGRPRAPAAFVTGDPW